MDKQQLGIRRQMKALAEIVDFGAHDADSDALLYDCFEDHEAYEQLLTLSKFLVLGRKGAGKTAIFRKLQQIRKPSFFSYGHTFTDYPWEHHAWNRSRAFDPVAVLRI